MRLVVKQIFFHQVIRRAREKIRRQLQLQSVLESFWAHIVGASKSPYYHEYTEKSVEIYGWKFTLYSRVSLTRFNRHSAELRAINNSAEVYDEVTPGHHWRVKEQQDIASDRWDTAPEKPRRGEWRDDTATAFITIASNFIHSWLSQLFSIFMQVKNVIHNLTLWWDRIST